MHNITIIVAMDRNRAIGKEGKIPWHLPADIKHFVDTTTGKVVVMGRKTYDSIPEKFKPLPNRINIVLTRDLNFTAFECRVMHSVDEILRFVVGHETFIIGGREIYELFLPHTQKIVITHVDTTVVGDTFFPTVVENWTFGRQLLQQEANDKHKFSFSITEYTRK